MIPVFLILSILRLIITCKFNGKFIKEPRLKKFDVRVLPLVSQPKVSQCWLVKIIENFLWDHSKVSFSYFWQLLTFSFRVSSNLLQQKSPTAEIIGIYFLGTIAPRKYRPIIFAVGLFCCEKFEETPNEKVVNMSKLTKDLFI